MTLLSVIIPNYNMARYLGDVFSSLKAQTFKDFEILFIDDGSTDQSLEFAHAYQKNEPRLKVIKNEKNIGAVATINHGLKKAIGKYVFFFAADDKIIKNTFFEEAILLLENNPEYPLCTSDHGKFYEATHKEHFWRIFPEIDKPVLLSKEKMLSLFSAKKNGDGLYLMGTLFKKDLFFRYSLFNNQFHVLSDWYLIHLFALHEGCIYLPNTYVIWRDRGKANLHHSITAKEHENVLKAIGKNAETKKLFIQSKLLLRTLNLNILRLLIDKKLRPFFFHFFKNKMRKLKERMIKSILKRMPC